MMIDCLVVYSVSVVDEAKSGIKGRRGNLNGSPDVREASAPSLLHSDSPKSQHSRWYSANERTLRRTEISALVLSVLDDYRVRAASRKVPHGVSQ
jgi:hypothetical protein